MMTKLADPGARADAYANITDTVVTLGADGPYDFVNYNAHYGWALNAIQNGHPEWLVSEMNMRIDREHFLPSMPTV